MNITKLIYKLELYKNNGKIILDKKFYKKILKEPLYTFGDNTPLAFKVNKLTTDWFYTIDFQHISMKYPEIVFEISIFREDEELPVHKTYFKDGQMQQCPVKFCFDLYNENSLRTIK